MPPSWTVWMRRGTRPGSTDPQAPSWAVDTVRTAARGPGGREPGGCGERPGLRGRWGPERASTRFQTASWPQAHIEPAAELGAADGAWPSRPGWGLAGWRGSFHWGALAAGEAGPGAADWLLFKAAPSGGFALPCNPCRCMYSLYWAGCLHLSWSQFTYPWNGNN